MQCYSVVEQAKAWKRHQRHMSLIDFYRQIQIFILSQTEKNKRVYRIIVDLKCFHIKIE